MPDSVDLSVKFRNKLHALIAAMAFESDLKRDYGENWAGPDSKFIEETESLEATFREIVRDEILRMQRQGII